MASESLSLRASTGQWSGNLACRTIPQLYSAACLSPISNKAIISGRVWTESTSRSWLTDRDRVFYILKERHAQQISTCIHIYSPRIIKRWPGSTKIPVNLEAMSISVRRTRAINRHYSNARIARPLMFQRVVVRGQIAACSSLFVAPQMNCWYFQGGL